MSSDAALPPLYAKWMDRLLGGGIPAETAATCLDCGRVARIGADPVPGLDYYHPETKCCTYHPLLAGFLVGRIFLDDGPGVGSAKVQLEERIESGVGVIPTGIEGSPLFKMAYGRSRDALFGRTRRLRCPYYIDEHGGACGIRGSRPGICATWFCRHTRGRRGIRFWNALNDLLAAIEYELSLWCVARLALDPDTVGALLKHVSKPDYIPEADDIDGCMKPARRRQLWGAWRGRERKFYLESARIVEPMSWDDVLNRCGPRVALLAELVKEAHRTLCSAPLIPSRLRAGEIRLLRYGSEACFVSACEEVLEFPRRLMDALSFFDSRTVAEARDAVLKEKGLWLSDGMIEQLVDFELLVPVDDPRRT